MKISLSEKGLDFYIECLNFNQISREKVSSYMMIFKILKNLPDEDLFVIQHLKEVFSSTQGS